MLRKTQSLIISFLTEKGYVNSEHLYIRLVLIAATGFAVFIHLIFIVIYIAINIPVLVAMNVLSFLVYTVSFLLVKNGYFTLCGLSISLEVAWYTVFSAYYLGLNSLPFLYIFVVLLMQIIIPYAKYPVRAGMAIVLWCCIIVCVLFGNFTEPKIILSVDNNLLLGMINANVAFLGMILVVWIGNFVQKVIANSNLVRLEELRNQAYTDPLTGLHNRRYADKLFTQIRDGEPDEKYCIALLDIDDFKAINDAHGHAMGDTVLIFLADLMRKSLRKTDSIVRWGGEEFLLLLHGTNMDEARVILEKLRENIAELQVNSKNERVGITVTIGLACINAEDIEASINIADQRLYRGKTAGKNSVIISDEFF